MRRSAPDVVGASAVAAGLLFLWREVVFAPNAIISGDLFVPFRFEAVVAQFASFWNPILEFPNVETIDRLVWAAPFLVLGDPRAIQLAMIGTAVVGSGLLMFFACRRLGAPVAVACLAGLVYGCNPWIANRVQHLFLLPGYAVLPAVAALWIRPPRRRSVLWMVLLLSFGSTTPHTTVALWGTSVVLVAVRATRASLRRLGLTAFWYGVVNLYWILPVLAFMATSDLVPSWPTWNQVELFSRNADLGSVTRLGGYWWPLAPFDAAAWTEPLGFGLVAAFLLGLRWLDRERAALAVLAVICGVVALGTANPWWVGPLVVEGPLADRMGWLLRDPNKAVGPLAAFMLLLIAASTSASGRPGRGRRSLAYGGATVILLGAYLGFAEPRVDGYVREAYDAHRLPHAFGRATEWLEGRAGRVVWLPSYFGARTFWNDDQSAADVLAASSPVPVVSPYGYDDRARRAFMTLDFGAVLGDVPTDLGALMRRWGIRWLVHHRDVPPLRLQPSGTFDNRVETRGAMLRRQRLREAAEFDGVTVYDAGAPVPAGPVRPHLSQRPTAAAALLSSFGERAAREVAVDEPHPAVEEALILPGDEPRLLLAPNQIHVDLAGAAPYAAPADRWSRFAEADLGWWPMVAVRGGPPPSGAGAVVTTSRPGAELRVEASVAPGRYRLWARVYRGRDAGAVRISAAGTELDAVIELASRSPAMTWTPVGTFDASEPALRVRIENLAGSNVLAELRAIPKASWDLAESRMGSLKPNWVWPRPSSCPSEDAAETEPLVLAANADLPWDGWVASAATWGEIDAIELDLRGGEEPTDLEVWTRSEGVWIMLGRVHVGWQGWRTALVPVTSSDLEFALSGAAAPVTSLRLLPVDEDHGVRLAEARLLREESCGMDVRIDEAGAFELRAAGEAPPFPVVIDGSETELSPVRPVAVRLDAGRRSIEFPAGVPLGVRTFWLRPEESGGFDGIANVSAVSGDGSSEVPACSNRWRLWRSDDRYIDGLRGVAGGREVEAVAIDGLLAGFWLPPGTCDEPTPRNPWRQVGTTSLVASVLGAMALVVLSVVRRLP